MAAPLQPKLRLKDRRRRLIWVKVAAGTSVVALAIAAVFYVSHLPRMTVAEIHVSGTELVSADDVRALVSKHLVGSYAFIVPRANALAAPRGAIRDDIQKTFPPVAQASVSRTNLTTLSVVVTERKAVALWCAGVPSGELADDSATSTATGKKSGACYLMDQGGFVFAPSATTTLVRFYGDIAAAEPVGSTYLTGSFASLEKELAGIASSIKKTPKEALVDNKGQDVSVAFAEGGIVRFVRTADPQLMVENIASVFASQSFKENTEFEYADFRFGDKVYVKFK